MTVLAFAFTWLGRILALTAIAAALFVAYFAVLQWSIERADRKRRQAEDTETARALARQFFPPQPDCPGCEVYDQYAASEAAKTEAEIAALEASWALPPARNLP